MNGGKVGSGVLVGGGGSGVAVGDSPHPARPATSRARATTSAAASQVKVFWIRGRPKRSDGWCNFEVSSKWIDLVRKDYKLPDKKKQPKPATLGQRRSLLVTKQPRQPGHARTSARASISRRGSCPNARGVRAGADLWWAQARRKSCRWRTPPSRRPAPGSTGPAHRSLSSKPCP